MTSTEPFWGVQENTFFLEYRRIRRLTICRRTIRRWKVRRKYESIVRIINTYRSLIGLVTVSSN